MKPQLAFSNRESWERLYDFFDKDLVAPRWNRLRAILVPLIDQAVAAGFNDLFRAGQSLDRILLSTLDRHGLNEEPFVAISVMKDSAIKIDYCNYKVQFGKPIQSEIVMSAGAFQALTAFLVRLWNDTVSDPLPDALKGHQP